MLWHLSLGLGTNALSGNWCQLTLLHCLFFNQ